MSERCEGGGSITKVILKFTRRVPTMKVELVTNLKRQATKILADLHESKEPILITEHGIPSAYLVDVDDYQFMQKRLALLDALARGERAVVEGNTISHEQAKERLSKWLK